MVLRSFDAKVDFIKENKLEEELTAGGLIASL